MSRWLLNSLSTLEIALVVVGGSVAFAIAGVLVARRVLSDRAAQRIERVSEVLRVPYELLFALILTFGIALVLDKYDEARHTVDGEATALAQLLRTNLAFSDADQQHLGDGLYAYVNAIVEDEWPAMRDGTSSPEVHSALNTLYALYQESPSARRARPEAYRQALQHLDEATTKRRERLSLRDARLPAILAVMLPLGALLLLALELRPQLGVRSQVALAGTLAFVLSSTYLLTIVLDYPFSGDSAVANEPLRSGALASLEGEKPREPQPGDRALPLTRKALVGVWDSPAYGTIVLRRHGARGMRGVYREGHGTVNGVMSNGVFRGVWCEAPTRRPRDDQAGLVEWRLVRTSAGRELVTGRWRYGYARRRDGSFRAQPRGGWDLERLELDGAYDLKRRAKTDPPAWYCRAR